MSAGKVEMKIIGCQGPSGTRRITSGEKLGKYLDRAGSGLDVAAPIGHPEGICFAAQNRRRSRATPEDFAIENG
ncbi:MAG: hypothetical protein C4531_10190 [Desulfurivibrio sp.]|nr:MAG: hypothetical protein C4531_10190 [Desulfurivibrio sp.]